MGTAAGMFRLLPHEASSILPRLPSPSLFFVTKKPPSIPERIISWSMTFKSVLQSLQEVFPQIDLRVLKAIAIEHSNDVDAAVEFVLSEVLPYISEPTEASDTLQNIHSTEHVLVPDGMHKRVTFLQHQGAQENEGLLPDPPTARESTFWDDYACAAQPGQSRGRQAADKGSNLIVTEELDEPSLLSCEHEAAVVNTSPSSRLKVVGCEIGLVNGPTNSAFHSGPQSLIKAVMDTSLCELHVPDEPITSPEPGNIVNSVEQIVQPYQRLAEFEHGSWHSTVQEFYGKEASGNNNPVSVECGAAVEKDMNSYKIKSGEQSRSSAEAADTEHLVISEVNHPVVVAYVGTISSVDDNPDPVTSETGEDMNTHSSMSECEEQQGNSLAEIDTELVASENEEDSVVDSYHSSTLATLSGQAFEIDFLEDFIADAKGSKEALASAMKLATSMLKDVVLHEDKAKQAKEEASMAAQDILKQVDELRQLLKNAKESNDKCAGEVYGEKSILATKAWELKSRLISMVTESDKSLSVIDEIRQTLETRLAAAEEERAAAERERLEKEELARKSLTEQEAIMMDVVQESKRLKQETEKNSKLRDVLMDRGRIIDNLQGEIAVICEDVMSLKERVDGRVPLNKSVPSPACSLASTKSPYNKSKSSDTVLHTVGNEGPRMTKEELPEDHHLEINDSDNRKADSDDEWEIFNTPQLGN